MADESPERRPVDLIVLIAAPATLLAAAYVLTDGADWLGANVRWVLAGGAVLVGLLMLVGSRRSGRQRKGS